MGERTLQVGERLRPLPVPHALGDTRLHMALQQLNRDRVESLFHGTQLNQQILARLMLTQKPVDPTHLPLDSLQAMADSALDFGLQVVLGHCIHDDPFPASPRTMDLRNIYPWGYDARVLRAISDPKTWTRTVTSRAVGGVREAAAIEGEAAAPDALGETDFETLELGDPLIDSRRPLA